MKECSRFLVGTGPSRVSPKMFKKQNGMLASLFLECSRFFVGTGPSRVSPKMFKKQDGMLAFFFLLLPLAKMINNWLKWSKNDHKCCKSRALGILGAMLVPRQDQSWKKLEFWLAPDPPEGCFWESFRHLFLFGTLSGPSNGDSWGFPFRHHFFNQFVMKSGGLWKSKNLDYTW